MEVWWYAFLVIFGTFPWGTEGRPDAQPKLIAFQEATRVGGNPESKVTISIGEKNGFQYTLNGLTYSTERVAVSGEYYNDDVTGYGYTRMYLVVDSGVAYYALRPSPKRLDIYVQNFQYEEFYFEIYPPYPVTSYDLHEGQINATAILVTGPSKSNAFHPGKK